MNSLTFLRLIGDIIVIVGEDFGREFMEFEFEHFDEGGGSFFDSVHERWLVSLLTNLFFFGNIGEAHWDLWLFNRGGSKWDDLVGGGEMRVFNRFGSSGSNGWNRNGSIDELSCRCFGDT